VRCAHARRRAICSGMLKSHRHLQKPQAKPGKLTLKTVQTLNAKRIFG